MQVYKSMKKPLTSPSNYDTIKMSKGSSSSPLGVVCSIVKTAILECSVPAESIRMITRLLVYRYAKGLFCTLCAKFSPKAQNCKLYCPCHSSFANGKGSGKQRKRNGRAMPQCISDAPHTAYQKTKNNILYYNRRTFTCQH